MVDTFDTDSGSTANAVLARHHSGRPREGVPPRHMSRWRRWVPRGAKPTKVLGAMLVDDAAKIWLPRAAGREGRRGHGRRRRQGAHHGGQGEAGGQRGRQETGEVVNKGAYATGKQKPRRGCSPGSRRSTTRRAVSLPVPTTGSGRDGRGGRRGRFRACEPASTAPKKKTTAKKPAPKKNMSRPSKRSTTRLATMTDKLKDKPQKAERGGGAKMEKADISFVGLIAFFAIMVLIVVMLWPYFHELFEPGGLDRNVRRGSRGVPHTAGTSVLRSSWRSFPARWCRSRRACGPWIGALVILAGCVISSAAHLRAGAQAGAPVQSMVPVQYLEKFRKRETGAEHHRVHPVLIPVCRKTFTYLVPLTDMNAHIFAALQRGAHSGHRVSTYAADGLADGRLMESAIIFAVAAVIAVLGIVFRERIMKMLEKHSHKDS
ncbi:MAG: hypothetical protein ACLT98_08375 [Eggerthellaceae bacterium]